jgi:HEAT repeat protein
VPALTAAFSDLFDEEKQSAAEGLGKLGSMAAGAVPVLAAALDHYNPAMRLSATAGLGRSGQPPALPDPLFLR